MVQHNRRTIFLRGVIGNVSAQLTVIIASLITIPIGLRYFGTERFGAWMVIESILIMLNLSQYGMRTASSAMLATETNSAIHRYILGRAIMILVIMAVLMLAVTIFLSFHESIWMWAFGSIAVDSAQDIYRASVIILVFYIIKIPTVAFTAAFTGMQDTHLERVYASILPILLGLLALIMTIQVKGGLVELAWFTGIAHLFAGLTCGLHLALRHPELMRGETVAEQGKTDQRGLTRKLLHSGNKMFIVGMAAFFVWGTDNLVISVLSGAENVTPYAVTFRGFMVAYAALAVVNFALWPMMAKAVSNNDWAWASTIYQTLLTVMPVMGGAIWMGGILVARPIIETWAGPAGYGGPLVVFSLGAYAYVLSQISTTSSYLSATNSPQVSVAIAEAVLNLVLSIVLFYWLGIGGVASATVLAASFTAVWVLPRAIRRNTAGRLTVPWQFLAKQLLFATVPSVATAIIISRHLEGWWLTTVALIVLVTYVTISWYLISAEMKAQIRNIVGRLLGQRREITTE